MEEIVEIEELEGEEEIADLAELARKVEARMNKKTERPDCVTDHQLTYLDILVCSVGMNECKAAPYLVQRYGVELSEADTIVNYWVESYDEHDHPWAEQCGHC
jgi:hypothetical protein